MYTSKLVSVAADSDYPNISVSTFQFYKDGVEFGYPDAERGLTAEQLVNYCRQKIRNLEETDKKVIVDQAQQQGMADLIANPPLGDVDISFPPLTDKELARQTYEQALNDARQAKEFSDLKASADPEVMAAMATLTAAKAAIIL